jgi:UDP-N-acetylglucosamine 2-epimerase (non-hydrolysing)
MHIEAGVRSGRFWRPFPEEISRRFVSRLTDVHFAPGARESLNLRQQRGEVINTFHNTSRDALFDVIKDVEFGDDGYLVVTLHRTELLSNKKHFTEIVKEIINLSTTYEIRWFLGNHERVALESNDIFLRLSMSSVQLFERTSHEDFIRVLARAKCVLTDSGGLQSECNDLGIPVIVHRKESEYTSPDYAPCILTNWKVVAIDAFLRSLQEKTVPRGIRSQIVATEMIVSRIAEEMKGN